MRPPIRLRAAVLAGAAAALLLPAIAVAAEPAPPPATSDWQAHLAAMAAMPGPLGDHITGCVTEHGSMAGLLGPKGAMVQMMGGMMR